MSLADRLLPDGFTLERRGKVASTNDEARDLARAGAPSGSVVVADEQTLGRGRHGRRWSSPPGNLYASIVLRPDCQVARSVELSFIAGLALAEAIREFGPKQLDVKLKWPNDVLIAGAKTAGILLEGEAGSDGRCAFVIIGTGVNIVSVPEIRGYAVTSLAAAGFGPVDRLDLLNLYVARLVIWLDRWQREGFPGIRQAWQTWSFGLGQPIRLRLEQGEINGRFVDLSERGALVLEQADGRRREIAAGDLFYLGA